MKKVLLSVIAMATLTSMATAGESVVKSKVPVLKFSGTHYLGFVSSEQDGDRSNKFETRRNYLQVKSYMKDNKKSYMRLTLDTHQLDDGRETVGKDLDGSWNVRLKYAFLYLDEVLPNTGIEMGQVHRPWIDHEEHGGWNYRSISKVYVEDGKAGHLTNSADLGFNIKTKLTHFSSELGVFNGEGYHNTEDGEGLSSEWRLTGHLLGTGKKKRKEKVTYADVSFLGQLNEKSNKHKNEDLHWYGLHAVYNQPEFLVAAQYIATENAHSKYAGDGYSVNGEYRFTKKWDAIGRYDTFTLDESEKESKRALAGVVYKYNKNVKFIGNYLKEKVDGSDAKDSIMLTAEVKW